MKRQPMNSLIRKLIISKQTNTKDKQIKQTTCCVVGTHIPIHNDLKGKKAGD